MTSRRPSTAATEKARRNYNSPLREQQSAETLEKIIAAGAQLIHELPAWDWTNLSAAVVSERAGVSERTVRRYFSSDSKMRDAVLKRLVEESGLDLDGLRLDDFGSVIETLFLHLQSFAAKSAIESDSAFETLENQRRDALLKAVAIAAPTFSAQEQKLVTAVLDMLWYPPIYERLSLVWGLDNGDAIKSLKWLNKLINNAIQEGDSPLR